MHRDHGDRNPLHYDAETASRSRFGGLIVQGGVTSGLLNAVVAEDLAGQDGTVVLDGSALVWTETLDRVP